MASPFHDHCGYARRVKFFLAECLARAFSRSLRANGRNALGSEQRQFKPCLAKDPPLSKDGGAFACDIAEFDGKETRITEDRIALLSARKAIHFPMVGENDSPTACAYAQRAHRFV
jgi:hypothetical protein